MADRFTGGCACGAIRYQLRENPYDTGWCHCRLCQRSSGAPAIVFTTVGVAAFSITHGELATWRSSDIGERGYCARCGCLLTMRVDFQRDTIDIAAATLDRPDARRWPAAIRSISPRNARAGGGTALALSR